jgi:hypothetical protein
MIIVLYRAKDATHPTAPATPWATVEHSAGWSTLYPLGRRSVRYHAWLAVDGDAPGLPPAAAGRGVWVVCCEGQRGATRLKAIAAASPNAWTLRELRADGGALATAIKNNWPRPRDENGDPIPGPIALGATIAGRDSPSLSTEHATFNDIPDGGDEP